MNAQEAVARYNHPCPACLQSGASLLDTAGRVTCLLCTVRWPVNQRDPSVLRDTITSDPQAQLLTLGKAVELSGWPIGRIRETVTHGTVPIVGRDSDNRRYIYSRHLDHVTRRPGQ